MRKETFYKVLTGIGFYGVMVWPPMIVVLAIGAYGMHRMEANKA